MSMKALALIWMLDFLQQGVKTLAFQEHEIYEG